MHFPRQQRRTESDERILPLTNVVFLLLIFFMLVGRLATPSGLDIDVPASASEAPVRGRAIVVQITTDGRLALEGLVMPPAELKAAVSRRLSRGAAMPVRLRADGAVAATRVVAVMRLLREAGVEELALVTRTPANPAGVR